MQKPNLYLQFSPSKIPNIDNYITMLSLKENSVFEANKSDIVFDTKWNKVEQLDEVLIKANAEKKNLDKLTKFYGNGRIDVFDDEQRENEIDLATYLNKNGFQVFQRLGAFQISRGRYTPTIFLNKQRLTDLTPLFRFNMKDINHPAIESSSNNGTAAVCSRGGDAVVSTPAIGCAAATSGATTVSGWVKSTSGTPTATNAGL